MKIITGKIFPLAIMLITLITLNSTTFKKDLIITKAIQCQELNHIKINNNFKKYCYTRSAMAKYNPDIADSTVRLFLDVVETFELDSTEFLFNVCISQLLKESGAQHIYSKRYGNRAGKLVVSSANAIGIAQIQGPTGYHFLNQAFKNNENDTLLSLGCDNFMFAEGGNTYSNRQKATEWLKKENNNLILWGYIMKETINNRKGNLTEALVCYNAGIGNLLKMLRGNVNLSRFSYVRNIYRLSNQRTQA